MEQPVYVPHPTATAAAAAAAAGAQAPAVPTIQAAPAAQTVQQLQLQALMHQQQHLAAQQQAAYPAAVAAAAAMPQDVAMQQYQAAQMQAMLAAQAATLRQGQPVNKRGKVGWGKVGGRRWGRLLSGLLRRVFQCLLGEQEELGSRGSFGSLRALPRSCSHRLQAVHQTEVRQR